MAGSIATVVTMGFGSFGSVNLLPTLGYGTGANQTPGVPGAEWAVSGQRTQWQVDAGRTHWAVSSMRLHWEVPEE